MANKFRAEVEIELCGEKITLHGTFSAMVEIETYAECNMYQLMLKLRNTEISVKEITAIIYGGMRGAGKKPDWDDIGEKVVSNGYVSLILPLTTFVVTCLSGSLRSGPTEKKRKEKRKKN